MGRNDIFHKDYKSNDNDSSKSKTITLNILTEFNFLYRFGAGSEYGRDIREEARRKKFGIISRKYKPEDQPWILKVGGKTGKK